ncbi:MAG: hypothetical protein HKL88_03685 [Bacteroidia bacterium]|nr:hypothetical protein [Bacteroidia bacterium]
MKTLKLILSLTLAVAFSNAIFAIEDIGLPHKSVKRAMSTGCPVDQGAAFLAINNVRARIMDEGDMWWNPAENLQQYFEPSNGNVSPEFAGALWVAGLDQGGQLKVAAMTYRQNGEDFWAGPLDTIASQLNESLSECAAWDKLFYMTRQEVQNFVSNPGNPNYLTSDIKNWPGNGNANYNEGHYLAPYIDPQGIGYYDPTQGCYPGYDLKGTNKTCQNELYGDATLWYVINDIGNGNIHTESRGIPIGLEIRVQAFAFNTTDAINNCTFYNYQIINRSSYAVENTYFGAWNDFDLGNGAQNWTGCDVGRSMGYGYEGTNFNADGSGQFAGEIGYHNDLPAIGEVFFQGPFADSSGPNSKACYIHNGRIGMARFMYFVNDYSNIGNPQNATSYYNYMKGLWIDGTPMTYGGNGYQSSSTPCSYMFPWTPAGASPGSSQVNTDPTGCGTAGNPQSSPWDMPEANIPSNDMRFVESAGPFTLQPGSTNYVTVGLVWDMTPVLNNQFLSISLIQQDADLAQALFNNCFKVLNGPDAPDVALQELNQELILTISNPNTSNNYNEQYAERSASIPPPYKDTMYKFEGYEVFQLLDSSVTSSQLLDPSVSRLVAECNINNDGTNTLINYTKNSYGVLQGTPEVTLSTSGIVHSFDIKTDQFQEDGQSYLVNDRPYYYMVIAFGYNNYCTFVLNSSSDSLRNGQQVPFIQGRNNVKILTGIPHIPTAQSYGTIQHSNYGNGVAITRLEGQGNGGNAIELDNNSITYILQNDTMEHPTYLPGQGPINIKVVDPLSVVTGNFIFKMLKNPSRSHLDSTARWEVYNQVTGETVYSDTTADYRFEQVIPQWGISITVTNPDMPLMPTSSATNNIMLDSNNSMTFSDPTKNWLSGVKSASPAINPLFWIRCGTYVDPGSTKGGTPGNTFTSYEANPASVPITFVDPNCWYSTALNGIWAPYYLCAKSYYDATSKTQVCDNGPKFGSAHDVSSLQTLSSIDLVITSNRADWTRCVVVEEQDQPILAEGGASKMYPRKSLSVDQYGNYATPGSGPEYTDPTKANYISDSGMGWFPGYAINVETGERLNMAFGEDSWLTQDNGRDMLWNPDSTTTRYNSNSFFNQQSVFGGKHYIYVFGHNTANRGLVMPNLHYLFPKVPVYDADKAVMRVFGTNNSDSITNIWGDCMWVNIPLLNPGHQILESDVTIHLRVAKPYDSGWGANWASPAPVNNNYPMYSFSLNGLQVVTNSDSAAQAALNLINIVPNPYYGYSSYESTRLDQRVRMTNLPPICNITIFTLNGTVVRVIQKNDPETYVDWDLQNQYNVPIASGMYIIHIDVPNVGQRTLKWFGVIRPVDLNSY